MGKKSLAVSKISSATAPTSTSTNFDNAGKSSLLRTSFAPSCLQLHLFASVIQSFESQQLRLHDVNSGRLRHQHATAPQTSITSVDWGYYGSAYRESRLGGNRKKRKRNESSTEDIVVAYGTSDSEVCMFSPAEGRVVGKLSGAHERGIRDFRFRTDNYLDAWSIGGDSKLAQWDLGKDQCIRTINLPDPGVGMFLSPSQYEPQILCASNTPYSVYPTEDFRSTAYDSFKGQVQDLKRSGTSSSDSSELFLASDKDRYLNIFDIQQKKLVRTLVASSGVESVDLFSPDNSKDVLEEQLLAVVTQDGTVELFSHPFKLPTAVNGDLKSKRKGMTRKADAVVKLVDGTSKHVNIRAAWIQGPDLVLVSVEGGVNPIFQKLRWQDEGTETLLFQGTKEVLKKKNASTLNAAQMNGVKDMGKVHLDESRTVVVNGNGDLGSEAAIEISSEDDESNESNDDDEDEDGNEKSEDEVQSFKDEEQLDGSDPEVNDDDQKALVKTSQDDEDAEMEDIEAEEPSFGDLLASKHPDMIAISDSFGVERPALEKTKQLALPSGMSLGTVLTQALRTNDRNLLESCLHANDVGIIQNTIQRLESSLAATLLSKLAERLASRPGRYGHLLSWVQWTCIAHGGAIAGQADVVAKIKTLYGVLTQRSKSLDKLLLLKGKLDMLDAQLALRKQMQAQRDGTQVNQGEPGMIYLEGETDNWSSEEDLDESAGMVSMKKSKKHRSRDLEDVISDKGPSSGEDDEEMLMTNGMASSSDDDEESDEEAAVTRRTKGGAYDLEAEVSGNEDGSDEDEGSEEDEEDEEDEDSSMDGFINDGEVSYASDEDDVDLDDEPQEPKRPEKKRSRHR